MKFKTLDEALYTTELWYDLMEGGYITPSEILEDPADVEAVANAIKVLTEFVDEAVECGAIEVG